MDPQDRLNLIAELELKRDHDVLILAAADIAELKTDFKEVCADTRDNTRRLTILETYWKTFVAIMAAAVIVVPVIVEILLR
jgi:hypothetical protein